MTRKGGRGRNGLLFIDSNLLLLLLVGRLDPDQIERFKRTRAYSRDDYALLATYVARFRGLVATPNVLTEISNLAGQLAEPLRKRALAVLGGLIGRLDERYVASADGARHPFFPLLGLADASILLAVDKRVTVLTDDLPLYVRLSSEGFTVINFHHLRSGSW